MQISVVPADAPSINETDFGSWLAEANSSVNALIRDGHVVSGNVSAGAPAVVTVVMYVGKSMSLPGFDTDILANATYWDDLFCEEFRESNEPTYHWM